LKRVRGDEPVGGAEIEAHDYRLIFDSG
jgi:hypothetical protein